MLYMVLGRYPPFVKKIQANQKVWPERVIVVKFLNYLTISCYIIKKIIIFSLPPFHPSPRNLPFPKSYKNEVLEEKEESSERRRKNKAKKDNHFFHPVFQQLDPTKIKNNFFPFSFKALHPSASLSWILKIKADAKRVGVWEWFKKKIMRFPQKSYR